MTRRQIIWEEFREGGFTLAATGVIAANLYTFYVILTKGVYQIWEPWKWLLITEFILDGILFIWGCERYYKDVKRAINRLWPKKGEKI